MIVSTVNAYISIHIISQSAIYCTIFFKQIIIINGCWDKFQTVAGGKSSSTHFQCRKLMKTSTIKQNMADVGFETIFMFKYGRFEKHAF